jgi:hypothetical protein
VLRRARSGHALRAAAAPSRLDLTLRLERGQRRGSGADG